MAGNFQDWLAARDRIRKNYLKLTPAQQKQYKKAWETGGASSANEVLQSFKPIEGGEEDQYQSVRTWLDEHPQIKNRFDEMNPKDQQTYLDTFIKRGKKQAKNFLHSALNIVSPDTSTTEIVDGVHVPKFTKYPTPTLLFEDEEGDINPPQVPGSEYDYVGGVKSTQTDTVPGIGMPDYDKRGDISGSTLQRVGDVSVPDYKGAEGIGEHTAAEADYTAIDPMDFATKFAESYREEVLKNANLADQIALQQLDTELSGLTDYVAGVTALKRGEISVDNAFNTAQRLKQVSEALPGVAEDLEGQRERAGAYAEGRLPDEMEDRMMELNVRSKAADQSGAAGFGAMSMAGQKAGDLMSAEQRLGVSQYGEQLLGQNIATKSELFLPPTSYSTAGSEISVMPSQSASVLSASSLGQLNELANISATTALGTSVSQEQFSASLANDISQFNAALQQDTEKFNSTMSEQQAQFKANMQTQIDTFNAQMEAAENLSEAEITQRTQEFNANMAVQQEQFQAGMQETIGAFNAQLAVNQNQFNAQISQRTNEFNANLSTQQNQFISTLDQRIAEFNTTMAYNTHVANAGIENAFSLGRFDYEVTYKGLIAGALNKNEDTQLMLQLAEKELAIYEEALFAQLELEKEKLEIMKANM